MTRQATFKDLVHTVLFLACVQTSAVERPKVLLILVDNLGYMDISEKNPKRFFVPLTIEALAKRGKLFTAGHGDTTLLIKPGCNTLTFVLPRAVYCTGRVGIWNLNWVKAISIGMAKINPTRLSPVSPVNLSCR